MQNVNEFLAWNDRQFIFLPVPLHFKPNTSINLFRQKNNKTVAETIIHKRYFNAATETRIRYPHRLQEPLGTFLFSLKSAQDNFYQRFLNRYGDAEYIEFWIKDQDILSKKGLYLYKVEEILVYLGRCKDSFMKRINNGYGKIHPKNCYVDGQATNCHINSMITGVRERVRLYVCDLHDDVEIDAAERNLIQKYQPPWNIQLI